MGKWLRVLEALLAVVMGIHGVAGYIAASVNHDDHLRATYEAVILAAILVAVGAGFAYGYPIIPCVSLWIAGLIGFGAGTSGVDPGYVYGASGVVLSGCSLVTFIMQQRRLHREN